MQMQFDAFELTGAEPKVTNPAHRQKTLKEHSKKLSADADDILDNSTVSMAADWIDDHSDPKSLYYYSSFGYSSFGSYFGYYPGYDSFSYSYSSYYPG